MMRSTSFSTVVSILGLGLLVALPPSAASLIIPAVVSPPVVCVALAVSVAVLSTLRLPLTLTTVSTVACIVIVSRWCMTAQTTHLFLFGGFVVVFALGGLRFLGKLLLKGLVEHLCDGFLGRRCVCCIGAGCIGHGGCSVLGGFGCSVLGGLLDHRPCNVSLGHDIPVLGQTWQCEHQQRSQPQNLTRSHPM